jgi:hypothetical protein
MVIGKKQAPKKQKLRVKTKKKQKKQALAPRWSRKNKNQIFCIVKYITLEKSREITFFYF